MRDHQRAEGLGRPGNLPLELDAFVGRAAELTGLDRALDASRLVTVTGPGGVGKSRLAARGRPPHSARRRLACGAVHGQGSGVRRLRRRGGHGPHGPHRAPAA